MISKALLCTRVSGKMDKKVAMVSTFMDLILLFITKATGRMI